MTPSSSAAASQKSALKNDQGEFSVHDIPRIEDEQEARVQAAAAKAKEEERELAKMVASTEQTAEETLRAQAKEELTEYKTTELAKILAEKEREAEGELAAIDTDYTKNAPKLSAALVDSVLDFSFISQA